MTENIIPTSDDQVEQTILDMFHRMPVTEQITLIQDGLKYQQGISAACDNSLTENKMIKDTAIKAVVWIMAAITSIIVMSGALAAVYLLSTPYPTSAATTKSIFQQVSEYINNLLEILKVAVGISK